MNEERKAECNNCTHWTGEKHESVSGEFKECEFKLPEWLMELVERVNEEREGLNGPPVNATHSKGGTCCGAHQFKETISQLPKVGDVVDVYQKPLSNEEFEGKAIIIRITDVDEVGRIIRADVQFDGEAETYPRTIYFGD